MTIRKFFSSGSWGSSNIDACEPMSDELERRLTAHELAMTYSRGASLGESWNALKRSSFGQTLGTTFRAAVAFVLTRPI